MREFAKNHFLKSADIMMQGQAGQTCTLDWLASHTDTFDTARQEYGAGTATRAQMENVACMVHSITGNEVRYGQ